jgi:hypothetical protein
VLQDAHQHGSSDRAHRGNLAEPFPRRLLFALRQQFAPRLLAQCPQLYRVGLPDMLFLVPTFQVARLRGMPLPILGILDLLLLTVSSVSPSTLKCTLLENTREDFDDSQPEGQGPRGLKHY